MITFTSLHPEPTDPLSHTFSLPSTTPTSQCCLLFSAQHSTHRSANWTRSCNTLGNWIPDFLSNRHQTVWIRGHTSSALLLNTHGCTSQHGENSTGKFTDDTTIISRISNNGKTSHRLVLGCPFRTNVKSIRSKLQWLTVDNRLACNLLSFFTKFIP